MKIKTCYMSILIYLLSASFCLANRYIDNSDKYEGSSGSLSTLFVSIPYIIYMIYVFKL